MAIYICRRSDRKLSVAAKPEQNTTVIEANDQYEFLLPFELLSIHLIRCP